MSFLQPHYTMNLPESGVVEGFQRTGLIAANMDTVNNSLQSVCGANKPASKILSKLASLGIHMAIPPTSYAYDRYCHNDSIFRNGVRTGMVGMSLVCDFMNKVTVEGMDTTCNELKLDVKNILKDEGEDEQGKEAVARYIMESGYQGLRLIDAVEDEASLLADKFCSQYVTAHPTFKAGVGIAIGTCLDGYVAQEAAHMETIAASIESFDFDAELMNLLQE